MAVELSGYDIILLIDKSGSMSTNDCNGKSRWEYAQESTLAVAHKAQTFDQDGISVGFFANQVKIHDNVTPEKVSQVFQEHSPMGSTNTAAALQAVFDKYFANPAKPILVLVVTDGAPDSREAVMETIIAATQKMDADEQIGISFVQVGSDPTVPAFLKELDDNLESKGAKFDIVDYKTFDELENLGAVAVLEQALSD